MISWFDIKKSALFLARDYKYSLVVVFSLAFSLGITLFLFTQIYTIKYKPLEFSEPEKIVSITRRENGWSFPTGGIYYFDFVYYNQHQTSFENLARYEDRLSTLQTDQFSERVQGAAVNAELFEITRGAYPVLGRALQADDNIHGSPQVAVIGYDLWQRLFGGKPSVIGELVTLNGLVYNIVGVMPEGFSFPINHEIWVNYPLWDMPDVTTIGWMTAIGRLKDGVTLAQAESELQSLAAQLRADYPEQFKGKELHVISYTDAFSVSMATSIGIMTIVGVAILLMGCFSVSNLLIVRMLENERESVIKSALGLPAWRIACKPLLESFWLCLIAGMLALIICFLGIKIADAFMYADGPYWWALKFQPMMFIIAIIFVLLMWLVTGLVPVFLSMRAPSNSALSSGRKGGVAGKSGPIMSLLIGVQIICAFVLMVLTGLSVEALLRSLNTDYGVKVDEAIVADVRLSEFSHPTLMDRFNYYDTLKQEIAKNQNVEQVAFMSSLAGFSDGGITYLPPGATSASGESFARLYHVSVSDNLFETMEITLLDGRTFTRFDEETSSQVGIVDERTARMIDPQGNVIGKQIQIDIENKGPMITIVGIVSTVLHGSPTADAESYSGVLYRPMRQLLPYWGTINLVVVSQADPVEIIADVKRAGHRTNPQIAVAGAMTYSDRLALNTRQVLSMVYNFLPAALLAFLMASLGIYGIATRVTMQKANDLGVMKAIGAKDSFILRTFLKRTWISLGISLMCGFAALMLTLPMIVSGSFVFTFNLLAIVAMCVVLLISVMVTVASIIPVSRLNRLSPQAALNFKFGA
jgi:predicted permease